MLEPDNAKLWRNLRRDAIGNTAWPPDPAALIALDDLGISNDRIARYFRVAASDASFLYIMCAYSRFSSESVV